jgi:hypothetical protein
MAILITLACVTVYLVFACLVGRRLRAASLSVEDAAALAEACAALRAGNPLPESVSAARHANSGPEAMTTTAQTEALLPDLVHARVA